MNIMGNRRVSCAIKSIFGIAGIFLILLLPAPANSQTPVNHPPLITSSPMLAVTAGQIYEYQITSTDRDNDEIVYSLTTGPAGMTLQEEKISWSPTKTGVYNVALEATDGKGGYDSQSWQIQVNPGPVAKLVILPNDRPTIVNIGDTKTFTAKAYDKYDNPVKNTLISWKTDEKYSKIDENGNLTALKGGITFAAATSGDITASVGVVVKDIRHNLVSASENNNSQTNSNTNTDINNNKSNLDINANTNKEEISNTESNTNQETEQSTETKEENGNNNENQNCQQNISTWLAWIILAIYLAILIAYYKYEKKGKQSGSWWIFPVLFTIIGLIIYYKGFCPDTYKWWPWALLIIGLFTTTFYHNKKGNAGNSSDSQNELPF